MTRRPLLHPVGRLAKAQSRMAPGGLLWSESPIPRAFVARLPMVGDDTPAPPVVPPTYRNTGYMNHGTLMGLMHWNYTPAVGDVFVATACGPGTALAAPAGWTVLASGTLPGHTWMTAYGSATATTTNQGQFTNGGAECIGVGFAYTGGTATPTVAAVVPWGPGVTSATLVGATGVALPVDTVIAVTDGYPVSNVNLNTSPPWTPTGRWYGDFIGGARVVAEYTGPPPPAVPQLVTFGNGCSAVTIGWGFS